MTAFGPASNEVEAQLVEIERRRCAAICAADLKTIETMMSDSLTYVHKNGHVENKTEYLDGLRTLRKFKTVERDGLAVRLAGDVAVMTGKQRVVLSKAGGEDFELNVFVTQVWTKSAGDWRMEVFQSTGI